MHRFILITLTCIFSALVSFSQYENAEVRYVVDNKKFPDKAFQQQLRKGEKWQNFTANYGEWYVIFNENNYLPHRAFGTPINVPGSTVEDKANNFLIELSATFLFDKDELIINPVVESKKYTMFNFIQTYENIEVKDSRAYLKFDKQGRLVVFGIDLFDIHDLNVLPSISKEQIYGFAVSGLNEGMLKDVNINSQLCILPIPENKEYKFHLIYEADVSMAEIPGEVPSRFITYIDAHTGEVLMRKNTIHTYNGGSGNGMVTDIKVSATVSTNPNVSDTTVNLPHLRVIGSSTDYTDSAGNVSFSGTLSSAKLYLDGKYAEASTFGSSVPDFTQSTTSGTNNISFDNNATITERSAYYHVNVVHDYMKSTLPSFTNLDYAFPANVDLSSSNCNAYYDGTSINFYEQGGGCYAMAEIADVIYHEYGHGINYEFYDWQGSYFANGAMGEGYADVWAFAITLNPVLAEGYDMFDATSYIRRYDTDVKVYPQDIVGEVHSDGEIIAGAWWDLYQNLGSMDDMMELFAEAYYALVTGPDGDEGNIYTDVLLEVLYANDNDADITNGTPDDSLIVAAFAKHGITLLSNAEIDHDEITSGTANDSIEITADITLSYAWALKAARLVYKVNDTTVWTEIEMVAQSNNYVASIPAQAAGTIVAYYIELEDNYNYSSMVIPTAANSENPNIPYFILIGFEPFYVDDFDDNFNGVWEEGLSADNATTGKWTIDVSVGSFSDPWDLTTVVQPYEQHTDNGIFCAVTGNASSASASLGENDVDDGATTLETPVFDLSAYKNPAITYYRWFINNPPTGANPGQDYWEVLITDDGNTWTKIERTNVSDKSWRRYAIRVSDYVSLTDKVQMRFRTSDSTHVGMYLDGGSLVEAAVDDFVIYEEYSDTSSSSVLISSEIDFNFYPNPAHDKLNIYVPEKYKIDEIKIIDMIGVEVKKYAIDQNRTYHINIEVSGLSEGMYQIMLSSGELSSVKNVVIVN